MHPDKKYDVIVMGASAGGLQAISFLLEKLPNSYPLPIIIVQHRSKDHRELLEEVLQSKCQIKVKQADEKENIERGKVYVAPPDYHLHIENNRTFSLSLDRPVSYSRPSIDVLFESAAEVYKDGLMGIILTGSNSDGSNGITAIKKNGGLTISQSPSEAEFPAMPQAAIDTKNIMMSLKLSEIHNFLLKQTCYE